MQVVGGIRLLAAMLMKLQEGGWSRSGISMASSFPSIAPALESSAAARRGERDELLQSLGWVDEEENLTTSPVNPQTSPLRSLFGGENRRDGGLGCGFPSPRGPL